jgi:chromosome segregation protein
LASQVKKIEEAEHLRNDLKEKYKEYLKRESVYLAAAQAELNEELSAPTRERAELDRRIEHLRKELASKGRKDASTHELITLEGEGRKAAQRREAAGRELGRIEGELSAHERIARVSEGSVPAHEANTFASKVQEELEALQSLEGQPLRARIAALIILAKDFARRIKERASPREVDTEALAKKKAALELELTALAAEEERVAKSVEALRRSIESEKDASREAERELFQAIAKRSGLEAQLAGLRSREEGIARELAAFKSELGEAGALIGRDILEYESTAVRDSAGTVSTADMAQEDRARQEDRRKKLERMKIKLEEIGAGNSAEVLKEHRETTERDQFLARELADLEAASQKLHALIEELTETLEARFTGGIHKINAEFEKFFKLMFGGGTASLSVIKEKKLRRVAPSDMLGEIKDSGESDDADDEEVEEGIDIAIALPHKRVKGLHMLSGGERALTSIALIFAMSQVNPPPFLILDETDAALDEANSRRYGDMIENLAKKSQLILITHNRETMARAGILYGVTMGNDGISKLLSVKFEDALAVAK